MTGTLTAHWNGNRFVIQMLTGHGHVSQHISLSGEEWDKVKAVGEEEQPPLILQHTQGDGQPVYCSKCTERAYHTNSVVDVENSKNGETAYKLVPLCMVHAMEAREVNTSRIDRLQI